MALFAVTAFVLFHFGLDRDTLDGALASGVLWVTLLLAAVLGVTRLFVAEREQGGIDGAAAGAGRPHGAVRGEGGRAVPLPRGARAGGACPAFGAAAARPGPSGRRCRSCSLILLLADVGLAAVGALVAALAVETRARELIVPLLLLPLLVPRRDRGGARPREPLLRGSQAPRGPRALAGGCSALYDVVFVLVAVGVFDYLLED